MRITKGRTLLAIAIASGGALAFLALHSSGKPTVRLPDGTVLSVQRISYGQRQPFTLKPWQSQLQKVMDQLPTWLSRRLPAVPNSPGMWEGGGLPLPGGDALYVWLTRRDSRSGHYVGTGLYWAEILDEHGCPFHCAQAGGITYNPRAATAAEYEVGWFAFQAFPRWQKRFRLRFYNYQHKFVGEFVVANPLLRGPANWETEPLPITKRDGDLTFTLQRFSLHANTNGPGSGSGRLQSPPLIAPMFEVRDPGRLTTEWEPVQMDLFDSLGNQPSVWPFKTPFLCPFESAWKLRVKFCGKENSGVSSNACWTVHHLKLPSPGSYAALSMTQQVQGLTLRLIGLAGAGHTSYSNDVPVRARPLNGLEREDYSETSMAAGSGGRMDTKHDILMPIPHVALLVSGLTEDQRISVQASDEHGRNFFAKIWEWDFPSGGFKESHGLYLAFKRDSYYFLGLDLPAEATELDLTVCVHRVRTVEFVVKPPAHLP